MRRQDIKMKAKTLITKKSKNDYIVKLFGPNCPYSDRCKSKGIKCIDCNNNRDEEDHFTPKYPPYRTWPIIYS
jgi:hypothetical protein